MTRPQRPNGRRRGSAYVMILACSVIVIAITLGGLALAKAQRESYAMQEDVRRARIAAASALEAATRILSPSIVGRKAMASGSGLPSTIDGVSIGYDIVDASDGDLINDITQPVEMVVEARVGTARQMFAASMTPRLTPIGMASYGIAASGAVKLNDTTVDASAGVYAGSSVTASSAQILAPVYSVGTMSGGSYLMTRESVDRASTLDISDPTGLLAAATRISYNALPNGRFERVVLSPNINPLGAATNPDGIYLVDCGGARIRIRDSRIVGTLIVLNASADSELGGSVNISAHDPRRPAIVWQGGLTVATSSADLREADAGTSLNPPGAAYLGVADTDKADSIPSLITGTMIVIGNMLVTGTLSVDGRVVVVGDISADGATIRVRPDPDNVVPDCMHEYNGFTVTEGTARREVDED